MQSTLNPKPTDDPHDVLLVAPNAVPVAPTDEELSKLAHSLGYPSGPQTHTASGLNAGSTVPPVDTTFRAAAVGDIRIPGRERSIGGRAVRAFTALLLAACTCGAAIAWKVYSDTAEQTIAQLTPESLLSYLPALEKPALSAQPGSVQPGPPAIDATVAKAPPPSAAPAAADNVTPATAATPVESAQSLQSMVGSLATMGQEIEQLKASIAQLKASQEQMSRDVGRISEQNLRLRKSTPSPLPAVARPRRPILPPPQAAAAPMPQAIAPPMPRQAEPPPQATVQQLADPELPSVPRPPMPVVPPFEAIR
jgi:hypothetical protein